MSYAKMFENVRIGIDSALMSVWAGWGYAPEAIYTLRTLADSESHLLQAIPELNNMDVINTAELVLKMGPKKEARDYLDKLRKYVYAATR